MEISQAVLDKLTSTYATATDISTLVEQFISYMETSGDYSTATIRPRKTHLHQFVAFCAAVDVQTASQLHIGVIEAYIQHYKESHAESTSKTVKKTIKAFIHWLERYKEIQLAVRYEQIRTSRHKYRTPRSLPHHELMQIIHSIENPEDALAIRVMYEAGLRIDEVVKLLITDVHPDCVTVHGKGSKERTVYISASLADKLRQQALTRTARETGHIFNNRGRPLIAGTLRQRLYRYSVKALGKEVQPHQFRHSYAMRLLENGCDIVTIQNQMGHESIETTRQYLRAHDEFLKKQQMKYGFTTE